MYTINFEANGLRPDMARFFDEVATAGAINNLINKRFAGMPIRLNVRHGGKTVYTFERK